MILCKIIDQVNARAYCNRRADCNVVEIFHDNENAEHNEMKRQTSQALLVINPFLPK